MKKLFLFSFLAMAFGVSFGQVNVVLRGGTDSINLSSKYHADSIAAKKLNISDSTVKYLTPTQLGFVAGRVDSSHLPLFFINVRYPLSVVATKDTLLFNVPFIDSIAALTFVSISDSGLKYVTPTASALKANINSQAFTGTPSFPTGATGVTQSPGDNSTKFATTAYADAAATPSSILNYAQSAYPLIGGTILAEPLAGGIANITSTSALTDYGVTITTSGIVTAGTVLCTITYVNAFSSTPRPIANGQNAVSAAVLPFSVGLSTTTATIDCGTALAASTSYTFNILTQR